MTARMEQAYKEIQRRDGNAEWHTWMWQRFALGLLVAFLLITGVLVWRLLTATQIEAFVQTVQIEDGKLVQVGIPQRLLAYEPPDGAWMDMLGDWVTKRRWKGEEPSGTRTKHDWAWLYRHTCGKARQLLQSQEAQEKPFTPGKRLTTIEIKSITATPTPQSYQVLWKETSIDQANPSVKVAAYTGTFTVGRLKPPTLADAMTNSLGLCVTSYDLREQP